MSPVKRQPAESAAPKLLELFERSGDAHVGQTLVRLARLAEIAHVAAAIEHGESVLHRRERGAQGRRPEVVTPRIGTEADR